MAEYNSVPLGRAGTGAAFILPESQAANRLLDTIDHNRQVEERNRLLRQQQAQQLAQDWQKNQLKVEGGLYWQPEFEKRYENHLQKGIKLRQMGINPYKINPNDPNQVAIAQQYLLERQGIESDIAARKAKESAIADQMKLIKSDPTAFRPKSVKEINDYINLPFEKAKGLQVPTLEKAFDRENEFFKLADPATISEEKIVQEGNNEFTVKRKVLDKPKTRAAAESILRTNPRGRNFIEDEIGVSIDEVVKYPDTLEGNLKQIKDVYDNNRPIRDKWAVQYGITSPEQAKPLIEKLATENYAKKKKYNSLLDDFEKRASLRVDPSESKLPYFGNRDQQIQEENLRLAKAREARLAAGDGDGSGNSGNYNVIQKTFYTKGKYNPDTKEREGVKPILPFDKYVAVNPVAFGLPQLESAYDISDGKNISKKALPSIEITGMGYTTVKGGKKQLKVTLVDKDGKEYMINPSDVPVKTRMDKGYQAALKAVGAPPQADKPSVSSSKAMGGYKIGQIDSGYKYVGGDPAKQTSWVKQ